MKIDKFAKLLLAAIALLLAINIATHLPLSGGSSQASAPASLPPFLQVGKTVNLGGTTGPVEILRVDPSGWVLIKNVNNRTYWANSNQWGSLTEVP